MYQLSLRCPSSKGSARLLGVESTCCLQSGSGRVRIKSNIFSFLINFWSALDSQNRLEEQTQELVLFELNKGWMLLYKQSKKQWNNSQLEQIKESKKLARMVSGTWEKTCPSIRHIRVIFLVTGFPHFSAGFLSHFIYIYSCFID